jgi:hypothetical protein
MVLNFIFKLIVLFSKFIRLIKFIQICNVRLAIHKYLIILLWRNLLIIFKLICYAYLFISFSIMLIIYHFFMKFIPFILNLFLLLQNIHISPYRRSVLISKLIYHVNLLGKVTKINNMYDATHPCIYLASIAIDAWLAKS